MTPGEATRNTFQIIHYGFVLRPYDKETQEYRDGWEQIAKAGIESYESEHTRVLRACKSLKTHLDKLDLIEALQKIQETLADTKAAIVGRVLTAKLYAEEALKKFCKEEQ